MIKKKVKEARSNGVAKATATTRTGKVRVAIQGIATSFHEVAAMTFFGSSAELETVECLSFHELCESLDKGTSNYAVMAIENSIAGDI